MSELAYIVVLRAQPGKAELLGEALSDIVKLTRREQGCMIVELHESSDNPATWMMYERWRDQAAFENHMQQSYTVRFVSRMPDLIIEPAEVRVFKHLA